MGKLKGIGIPTSFKPFGTEYIDIRSGILYFQNDVPRGRNWTTPDVDNTNDNGGSSTFSGGTVSGNITADGYSITASIFSGSDMVSSRITGGTISGGTITGHTIHTHQINVTPLTGVTGFTLYSATTLSGDVLHIEHIHVGHITGNTISGGTISGGTITGGAYRFGTTTPLEYPYVCSPYDTFIIVDVVSDVEVTLPAPSAGRTIIITKKSTEEATITMRPISGNVNGVASLTLTLTYQTATFISSATEWFMISKYPA